jgi:hypothetical protein
MENASWPSRHATLHVCTLSLPPSIISLLKLPNTLRYYLHALNSFLLRKRASAPPTDPTHNRTRQNRPPLLNPDPNL